MSAEQTLRSYADAFNRADVAALAGHYAASTHYTQPFMPEPATTPAEVEAFESAMFAGFSDVRVEIEWMVSSGDEVAAGVTVTATHTSDMPLPDGTVIPARGTTIVLRTAEHVKVDGEGRIVHHERYTDSGAFLAQLMPGHPVG